MRSIKNDPGYFTHACSSKNLAISEVITELEDELMNISILTKRMLKEKCNEISRHSKIIELIIAGSQTHFQEIEKAIEYEQTFFDQEIDRIVKGLEQFDDVISTETKRDKITVDLIKNLAVIEAKKRVNSELNWEAIPRSYEELQLRKQLDEINQLKEDQETIIRTLTGKIKTTDPSKVTVLASTNICIYKFYRPTALKTTLKAKSSYHSTTLHINQQSLSNNVYYPWLLYE